MSFIAAWVSQYRLCMWRRGDLMVGALASGPVGAGDIVLPVPGKTHHTYRASLHAD